MSPDWTASPHHVVAGAALSAAVYALARRRLPWLWAAVLGFLVTMAAEAMVEMAEYPLLFEGDANAQSYYDTVGDITASFIGALAGLVLALATTWVRRRRASSPAGRSS
ncbi:MAG TPA: hypothetical protein VMZ11_04860 [Mycobacteriales bacterium]|nr:hypothetical protein [Mycobacteriales bacterium]